MLNSEDSATGKVRNFGKQRRAVEFFGRPIAISERVENADSVELSIRFLDQALDIVLVVPTMIIASIGKDEQGAFGVPCTPHLGEAKIDGIEERGSALGGGHHHAALQILDAVGEFTG